MVLRLRSLWAVTFVITVVAVLITCYSIRVEKKLLRSYELNANQSLCTLCLGNDSCDPVNFRLDYRRHVNLSHYSGCLFIPFLIKHLFDLWANQNDKIFFGTLKLNDNTTVQAVAKSAGHDYCEMFEERANASVDLETIVTEDRWDLIPLKGDYSVNGHSLVICSKYDAKSHLLLRNFISSTISVENNNSRSWLEAWAAAHLSVELLILKTLNGYPYAPAVYGTCGRIYFVENCGYTLQYYLNEMDLNNRLIVAKELLKLALELTDRTAHPNYSFYLTDLTADNIAIQFDESSGSLLSLKVIDWSDVIVVANDQSTITNDKLIIHVSEHMDCGSGCLAYSKEDICRASISDHNIYAVCKEFFGVDGRLLHEITNPSITNKSQVKEIKELESLFKHCLWQSNTEQYPEKSRLDVAKLIMLEIQKMLV